MSSQNNDAPKSGLASADHKVIDERVVAEYLRRHPEFFQDKPSLLADLRIPHHSGGAVSLVERQIAALRDSNERLQKQLDSLIQIARENDRLNEQLHRLTLGVMDCGNLADLLELVAERLREDFAADLIAIRLLTPPLNENYSLRLEVVQEPELFRERFQRLLGAGKPYCGRLKSEQLEVLFGEHADAVGSVALLPLGYRGDVGLLAICSYDSRRFQSNADTAFLVRMAEVISAALLTHLQTPET